MGFQRVNSPNQDTYIQPFLLRLGVLSEEGAESSSELEAVNDCRETMVFRHKVTCELTTDVTVLLWNGVVSFAGLCMFSTSQG